MQIAIYLVSGAAIGLTFTYLCSRWADRPAARSEFLASSDDWGVQ